MKGLVENKKLVLYFDEYNDAIKFVYANYDINKYSTFMEKNTLHPSWLKQSNAYVEGYYLILNKKRGFIRYCEKFVKSKSLVGNT